jgi:hypothetical protein
MHSARWKKIPWVNGPVGFLSAAELPAPDVIRWTPRRKAEVVLAIDARILTAEEACRRYTLTAEELSSWTHSYRGEDVKGLRRTRYHRETVSR